MAELKLNNGRATLAVGDANAVKVYDRNEKDSVSIMETKEGLTFAIISTGDAQTVQTKIAQIDLSNAAFDLGTINGTTYTDRDGIGKGEAATKEQGRLGLVEATRLELAEAIRAARVMKGLEKDASPAPAPRPKVEAPRAVEPKSPPPASPVVQTTPAPPSPSVSPPPSPSPAEPVKLDASKIVVDKNITHEEQALFKQAMNTPPFVTFIKGNKEVKSAEVRRDGSAEIAVNSGARITIDKDGALIDARHPMVGGNVLKSSHRDTAVETLEKTFKELIDEFNRKN